MKDPRKWFRLTCESVRHPKIASLTPATRWAWIELIAYATEYETDGFIPHSVAKKFAKSRQIVELKRAELLEKNDPNKDGILLHDFLEHQQSKSELDKAREKKQNAGSQGGKLATHNRWHAQTGTFSETCEHCLKTKKV